MAWWSRRQQPDNALVAAATILQGDGASAPDPQNIGQRQLQRTPNEWQREVWDFYDSLGEFRQGITWKSNMLSRIRLVAAKKTKPDQDPEVITSGPAANIMSELAGGIGGQAQLMSSFGVHLDVPGECWLIGETGPGGNVWYTRSIEEVRRSVITGGSSGYEITDLDRMTKWRELPNNSLVVRVWRPHKRFHYVADSPARAARSTMRELELLNRHIQGQYMSRLASAGLVIFPDEITFPVRPEFQDAPDPFMAEWIEIAAEAIRTPGTAAGVIPVPIRVPGEYVDKIKLVDFTLRLDDKIIEKRASAIGRLAIDLDMPAEALLGTGQVNHWSAWLVDEQGVKIHVAPTVEVICEALTTGYLLPRLTAAGEDVTNVITWYDASDLILRPDRSESARELYDRVEITGEALRRESGFDESDVPSNAERERIILTKASLQPVNTFAALDELGYDTSHDTPVNEPRPPAQTPPEQAPPVEPGPAKTAPPTGPEPKTKNSAGLIEALTTQAALMHAIKVDLLSGVTLLHPSDCREHLFSCPVTHATWRPPVSAMPGTSGTYECWLSVDGKPMIGQRVYNGATHGMIESTRSPSRLG